MSLATIDDFLQAFPDLEVAEVSDLDNLADGFVQFDRLQRALDDGTAEIDFELSMIEAESKAIAASRRWCCDIARYRLDSYNPRDDVRLRYEDTLQQIRKYVDRFGSGAGGENSLFNRPRFSLRII